MITPGAIAEKRRSEIELGAEFDQPSGQDLRRGEPRRTVARVDPQNRAAVEQVIHVDRRVEPRTSELHGLADAEVDLMQPPAVDGAKRDQVDRRGTTGTGREIAAE